MIVRSVIARQVVDADLLADWDKGVHGGLWIMPGIEPLRCACGEAELFAVTPGAERIELQNVLSIRTRQPRVVQRPVRVRAWCERCWMARFAP